MKEGSAPILPRRGGAASQRSRSARARADMARFLAAPRSLPLMRLPAASCEGAWRGGNRPKLTFIGWKDLGPSRALPFSGKVAAGDMGEEGAEGRGRRRRYPGRAHALGGGSAARQQADGGALHVALAAGDLAGEAQPGLGAQAQLAVEQLRRIEEGVAVQAAQPRELGVLQAGDHAQDAGLLAVLELGLEAHHVPQRAQRIVLAQLHHGVRTLAVPVGVGQADGLHRPEAQGVAAALGHHLDGQAAVEVGRGGLPVLERGLLRGQQRVEEGLVLAARHRAVDVVGAGAGGAGLVVARLAPGDGRVDRVEVHDGGDGVEEGELGSRR